jgi:ribonuclease HI
MSKRLENIEKNICEIIKRLDCIENNKNNYTKDTDTKNTDTKDTDTKNTDTKDKDTKNTKDNVIIFTDGSCKGIGKKKCGYGVHFPDKLVTDISKPFTKKLEPYTNQRAELYAIYAGIKKVVNKYKFKILTIKTDSMYSIDCFTKWIKNWKKNGWKTKNNSDVKNKDILIKIDKYITKYGNCIKFEHVSAHSGIIGNEIADMLANKGADMS